MVYLTRDRSWPIMIIATTAVTACTILAALIVYLIYTA